MTEQEPLWSLPSRIILPLPQRERLERLCRARNQEISDVLSDIVLAYLEELPDEALAEPLPPAYEPTLQEQLHQHERELRRLKIRRNQLGNAAPAWIDSYMNDILQEIDSLKERIQARGTAQ